MEKGYWREDEKSDIIIKCNDINPGICDSTVENKNGCIKGYIGPLCETCDSYGKVWEGEVYAKSIVEYTCLECSG